MIKELGFNSKVTSKLLWVLAVLAVFLISSESFAFELGADDIGSGGYNFLKDTVAKNVGALAITGAGLFILIAGFGEKIKAVVGSYTGYVSTAVGVTLGTPVILKAAGYML